MGSPDYVWEKMYVAVACMCGEGTFKQRLADASVSALIRLKDDDLDGELAENLKHVLDWTSRNLHEGEIQREPDEFERKALVEAMLHILMQTSPQETTN